MSEKVETILGKVCFSPKGKYKPSEKYDRLDVVEHEGSSYVVLKKELTGVTPTGDNENYMLLAARGEKLKFSDLTEEEVEQMKLHFSDLTEEDIAELQKPAKEATEAAKDAADRLNALSDHRDEIRDGYWWRWNEKIKEYENTGETANGNTLFATFDVDLQTGELSVTTPDGYLGPEFELSDEGEISVVINEKQA